MGTFRGFDFGGVGPRYTLKSGKENFDTYLGGTRYFVFSTDLEFPVGLPNEFGMKGILFSDYGKVWRSGLKNPYIVDRNSMRLSLGFGLKWNSPFGPLKFEYGFAVKKAKGDDQRRFIFGYTTPM
jgi:outer membrane protein insertion porin family